MKIYYFFNIKLFKEIFIIYINIMETITIPTAPIPISDKNGSKNQTEPKVQKIYNKTYTRKDGSVVSKEYPQGLYNKKHYELNKSKYTNKSMCNICRIEISNSNKWHHNNSKRHQHYYNLLEKNNTSEYPLDFIA
jgi:hypothetical protein